MGRNRWVVVFCVWVGFGPGSAASAQTVSPLTIHNVTLHEATGTLTIAGVGFGTDPVVTVGGQRVEVLLGGTDTQIDVAAPSALWTTPGTYRLTIADRSRRAADTFVVASTTPTGAVGMPMSSTVTAPPGTSDSTGPIDVTGARSAPVGHGSGSVSPMLTENSANTAVGVGALVSNTSGYYNAALGVNALLVNTGGFHNTATGAWALRSNTVGNYNTASGEDALWWNTTGSWNTAAGKAALYSNTTANYNTAIGAQALYWNTGFQNAALGTYALFSNTTGFANAATGTEALYSNTEGFLNTASGYQALYGNTTGDYNTASGVKALFASTTGYGNTAFGRSALYASTGSENTAVGDGAGFNATTGSDNIFLGARVYGEAVDANTMRLGLPWDGANGLTRTFIAGIYGTVVSGGVPVVIDSNGQLGVQAPPVSGGVTPAAAPTSGLTPEERGQMAAMVTIVEAQQASIRELVGTVADERATIAALQATLAAQQARLARLEALVPAGRR